MSKRVRLPHSRHHIMIYDEDWELLSEIFDPQGKHPIGPGAAIREVVHSRCQALRQKLADKADSARDVAEALREPEGEDNDI